MSTDEEIVRVRTPDGGEVTGEVETMEQALAYVRYIRDEWPTTVSTVQEAP